MINFEQLEAQQTILSDKFKNAQPFSYLVIDNFCDKNALRELVAEMPDPSREEVGLSRDYVFAKNKFEKSDFQGSGPRSQQIFDELLSERFRTVLRTITGEAVSVDPRFHGGGYHQGGAGSFLDMHVDFDYHPLDLTLFRNLNILIYLNEDWLPEYRGNLKLRHKTKGGEVQVEPLFNRCVIMHTRDYTLHGYDPISFPEGRFRRSLAAYAYTQLAEEGRPRSTTWYPEKGGPAKRILGRAWPALVAIKGRFFGSATAKNR